MEGFYGGLLGELLGLGSDGSLLLRSKCFERLIGGARTHGVRVF